MITEKELDEMARRKYANETPEDEHKRMLFKVDYLRCLAGNPDADNLLMKIIADYKLKQLTSHPQEVAFQPHPPTTGASHMPPERVENGRQFQEEMIMAIMKRLKFEARTTTIQEDLQGFDSPVITIDYKDAREHFQHVIALVANTATQRMVRAELETIEPILPKISAMLPTCVGDNSPYEVRMVLNNRRIHLLRCLAELDAQFADLSEKIFGTDKPQSNEQTPQTGTV